MREMLAPVLGSLKYGSSKYSPSKYSPLIFGSLKYGPLKYVLVLLVLLLNACGGGGSNGPNETPVVNKPTPTPEPLDLQRPDPIENGVTLSGRVTFDSVPHNESYALNYDATERMPVRGATVYVLDNSDAVVAVGQTDANGQYQVEVHPNSMVKVRIRAELYEENTPSWVVRVTDNTNSYALYVLDGELANVGGVDSIRNLHAPSGWGVTDYTGQRAAAPFAILNAAYLAIQQLLVADPEINLPPVELRWSIQNIPVLGSRLDGNIGTSFYDPNETAMYILGHANDDADEYDSAVIVHEFSHFIEDTLSRTDSLGGSHTLAGALDMRVAFSEGMANAFAGLVTDGIYADASGPQQGLGYGFSLESNNVRNPGWFNENSIGKILYDIGDSADDGVDFLSLGYTPIFQTITSPSFIESPALTSIYLFSDVYSQEQSAEAQLGLETLLETESIFGRGIYGEGETNDSTYNISSALPVYVPLELGGQVNVCGNNRAGEYNGLDVRRFIRFSILEEARYRFTLRTTLGTGDKDPDAKIILQGDTIYRLNSDTPNFEQDSITLEPGDYILEVFDHLNTEDIEPNDGGSACFDVRLN